MHISRCIIIDTHPLALDTVNNIIYWGDKSTIHRAHLDGSGSELVISGKNITNIYDHCINAIYQYVRSVIKSGSLSAVVSEVIWSVCFVGLGKTGKCWKPNGNHRDSSMLPVKVVLKVDVVIRN